MGRRIAAFLIVVAATLPMPPAHATPPSDGSAEASGHSSGGQDPEAIANRLMREAETAAAAGDRSASASKYEEVTRRFPSLRVARLARIRGQQIRALSADAEPDLRAAFNNAKLRYAERGAEPTEEAIRALGREARSMALQQDIELWLAGEEGRAGRRLDALRRFDALLQRDSLTPDQAATSMTGLLRLSESLTERAHARRAVRTTLAVRPDQLDAARAARLLDEADDRLFAQLAWFASIALVAASLLRFGWSLRRPPTPGGQRPWRASLLFPLYAFAGAGFFAESWEHGRLLPFLAGGAAVTAMVALQRLSDTRLPPTGAWRFVTATGNIAGALAALYLVLYAANLQHLIGL